MATSANIAAGSQVWAPDPDDFWIDGEVLQVYGTDIKIDDVLLGFAEKPNNRGSGTFGTAAHSTSSPSSSAIPSTSTSPPPSSTYNTVIKSFAVSGSTASAYTLLDEMHRRWTTRIHDSPHRIREFGGGEAEEEAMSLTFLRMPSRVMESWRRRAMLESGSTIGGEAWRS